jgi:hypothetical protein
MISAPPHPLPPPGLLGSWVSPVHKARQGGESMVTERGGGQAAKAQSTVSGGGVL